MNTVFSSIGTKETPYNDVPSNIPVGFSDSIHLPASPERDEIYNDPFASMPSKLISCYFLLFVFHLLCHEDEKLLFPF